jgi:NAD-dependent oxidoreductase involved in siderophore biosynthesis
MNLVLIYITIRTPTGTLLTHCDAPLIWTSTITVIIWAHWTDDIICDVNPWSNTVTAQNLTPLPIKLIHFEAKEKDKAMTLT